MRSPTQNAIIFTIGHSNRSQDEFLTMLSHARLRTLVDVRRYPSSRRHPQFNSRPLRACLQDNDMVYAWEGVALGGHRTPVLPGTHPGMRQVAMRAYAAHMHTAEFRDAITRLLQIRQTQPTVIMCAERDPKHCHRSLIADYLCLYGVRVLHLVDTDQPFEHTVHPHARLVGKEVEYDASAQLSLGLGDD